MGVSNSASLVVGVPLSELYSEGVETQTFQKYDKNTGKPYEKKVKVTVITWMGKILEDNSLVGCFLN
jgi:hypothetical protein